MFNVWINGVLRGMFSGCLSVVGIGSLKMLKGRLVMSRMCALGTHAVVLIVNCVRGKATYPT